MAVMVYYPPDIKAMIEEVRKYKGKENKPLAVREMEKKIQAWQREQFRLDKELMCNH